jgi:Flp pilus assembly protein TadG
MPWMEKSVAFKNCGEPTDKGMSRNPRRPERGQALLEMAVVLPLLLLLLLGIIEIGRYAELAIVVANSARAGAIYGAQNLATAADITGMQTAAQTDANLGPGLIVTPTAGLLSAGLSPCTATGVGSSVTYVIVRTSYQATPLFSSTPFTLNGCAQIQVAQ